MKLKFLKEITILSCRFGIIWDKQNDGGAFSISEGSIIIGIKCYKKDPGYTFNVLMHEISEAIHTMMGNRFDNGRISEDYLFNFGHQSFETHNELLAQTIIKFIAS